MNHVEPEPPGEQPSRRRVQQRVRAQRRGQRAARPRIPEQDDLVVRKRRDPRGQRADEAPDAESPGERPDVNPDPQ
ncbi:MAG TPA: hypothetical protein VM266_12105 [Solirubrobacteraceae bacterium]|nr:hypothetical protein [Solirubrobacteraceae bacterium]